MKNTKIALSKLSLETANFANPRREAQGIPELALSIAKRGLMVPLQVRRDSDAYAVVDGGRRFRALSYIRDAKARARELKQLTKDEHTEATEAELEIVNDVIKLDLFGRSKDWRVPVLEGDPIVDGDETGDVLVEALVGNVARDELSSAELGRALAYLIDERKLLTGKQASQVLARSMAWVSRAKNGWNALSERGKAAWLNGVWTDQDVETVQSLPADLRSAHEDLVAEAREAALEAVEAGEDSRDATAKARARIKRAYDKAKNPGKADKASKEVKGPSRNTLGVIVQRVRALGDLPDEAELFISTLQWVLGDIGEGDLPDEVLAIIASGDDKANEEAAAAKAALAKAKAPKDAIAEAKEEARNEAAGNRSKPEPESEPKPKPVAKAKRRRRGKRQAAQKAA